MTDTFFFFLCLRAESCCWVHDSLNVDDAPAFCCGSSLVNESVIWAESFQHRLTSEVCLRSTPTDSQEVSLSSNQTSSSAVTSHRFVCYLLRIVSLWLWWGIKCSQMPAARTIPLCWRWWIIHGAGGEDWLSHWLLWIQCGNHLTESGVCAWRCQSPPLFVTDACAVTTSSGSSSAHFFLFQLFEFLWVKWCRGTFEPKYYQNNIT